MLQVSYIREHKTAVLNGLRIRNYAPDDLKIVDEIIALDDTRKAIQTENDELLAQSNKLAKEIGELYKHGNQAEAEKIKNEVSRLKESSKVLGDKLSETKIHLENLLLKVPNIPHQLVPSGKTSEDNEVYQDWADSFPQLGENPLPHWELAKKYNLIDFELGVKITGSGFPLFRNKGAKLQRALINFFLDEAQKAGYEEVIPPFLVNEETARATGQLPDKEAQMYYVEKDNLYLIPTAEVPLTNIYRDVILDEKDFPVKITGYTPCWRREAGAYGKDVRGLNRVHQFDKIEIVQIQHPEKSYDTLHQMLDHVKGILQKLELPFRILRLCGGDLGFTSSMTYDFEVYSAAQQKWLEVSSVSNFETFQSNRLKLRFRGQNNKLQLAHTLNGSALALARIVAALLENNQTPNGIKIPKAIQPYIGFDLID